MMHTVQCPHCDHSLIISETVDGSEIKCPGCKKILRLRFKPTTDTLTASKASSPPVPFEPDEPAEKPGITPAVAKRFLSMPWLVLVVIFGFLPWCEVSCSSKDFHWQVNQSGYQALYGGISSPFDSIETAQESASKNRKIDKEVVTKDMQKERSDFLMACSPFVGVFWVVIVAMVACICLMPLSGMRLGVCLGLVGLMLAMLVITMVAGMPLERRMTMAVQQAIRDDPDTGMMMVAAISSGKTVWFWLVLSSVLLIGATETAINLVWKSLGAYPDNPWQAITPGRS
jgi:phage FluMu protein Com